MIELRWIIPKTTTTDPKRLQFRHVHQDARIGGAPASFSEWQDVPIVIVPDDEFFHRAQFSAIQRRG